MNTPDPSRVLTDEQKTQLSLEPNLQFFSYAHLPPHLQAASKPFAELAWKIALNVPANAQRMLCIESLLIAKDAAVRAVLWKDIVGQQPRAPSPTPLPL